jgi:hypothetical protein
MRHPNRERFTLHLELLLNQSPKLEAAGFPPA